MAKSSVKSWVWVLMLVLLVWGVVGLALCLRRPEAPRQYTFLAFDTVCSVTIWDLEEESAEAASREVTQTLAELHGRFNIYNTRSELSRINEEAHLSPWQCSEHLWRALCEARRGWELTHGAFDPTISPLMKLWGFHSLRNSIPTAEELDTALANVGFRHVLMDDIARTVAFDQEGICLDFGGLAKGYACAVIAEILEKHGSECYILDFGGNVCLSGNPPPGRESFVVGIRSPRNADEVVYSLERTGTTIATSGNYERSRMVGGKQIGHIMDPRTGEPCDSLLSVTADCEDPALADILSTAIFVGGDALAQEIAGQNIASFLLIHNDADQTMNFYE